jgi:hypothetical protein
MAKRAAAKRRNLSTYARRQVRELDLMKKAADTVYAAVTSMIGARRADLLDVETFRKRLGRMPVKDKRGKFIRATSD